MCKVNCSFFIKIVVRRFASHIFNTLNKKWRQVQEKTREWSDLNYFQNCPFWTYIKKNQHIQFLVHDHSSWSTFSLHLVKGPRLSKLIFKKSDHGSWTIDSDHWRRPLLHSPTSWSIAKFIVLLFDLARGFHITTAAKFRSHFLMFGITKL